jgi:Peptidase C13 family
MLPSSIAVASPQQPGGFHRPPRLRTLREAGTNLVGGARLLLLGTGHERFHVGSDQAPMLIFIGLLTILISEVISADARAYFNAYGVALLLSKYLVLAMVCHALARIHGRRRRALALFVMLASMVPASVIAMHITDSALGESTVYGWLTWPASALIGLFVMTLVAFSPVYTALEYPRPIETHAGKTFASSLALAVAVWGILVLMPSEAIWHSWKQSPDDQQVSRINVEKTFHRQPELVAQSLKAVLPGRAGVTDLFFVGFAGYASEHVFLNEATSAANLLSKRFGAAGRAVLLANNRRTVDALPLASATNLRAMLAGVSEKMNVDEDILFLFLTSHGAPGRIAVNFWPLDLNQLTAAELKDMLDSAGIKWRVIVVSACYSGSFIDVLKDDNTLIMTASAADRASFGCGHDGAFTYFGDAYFGQALQYEPSFRRAFETAAALIDQRERAEGLTASLPQIHEGARIVDRLKIVEDRLLHAEPDKAPRAAELAERN